MSYEPFGITAIHRTYCSCTSCQVYTSVPLDEATEDHLGALLGGKIKNRTRVTFQVTARFELSDGQNLDSATPRSFDVRYGDREWRVSPSQIVRPDF